MINHGRIRGVATAGLLCAALAGCGAAAAATPPAAGAGGVGGVGGVARAAAAAVGCASVHEATSVTVTRYLVVKEPVNGGARTYTQRNATKVRALFRDFCAIIAHAGRPQPELTCAFKFGDSFRGTFYDGRRILATFGYSLEACPRLSLTAGGKTRVAIVIGKVAAAAPHLAADLAAVLGVPVSQV